MNSRLSEHEADVSTHEHLLGATDEVVPHATGDVQVSTHAPLRGATKACEDAGITTRVSTHAPLWGATAGADGCHPLAAAVSTHAPLWGATRRSPSWGSSRRGFNPRAPMGRDGNRHGVFAFAGCVSTHAPLWGATMIEPYTATMAQFQPTRPYGARPRRAGGKRAAPSFNPRAPMGRDHAQEAAQANPLVSTHAPLWGATPLKRSFAISSFEFQPTRPYGARPDDIRATKKKLEFQPTRPYGARPGTACACTRAFRFQPTRPYGARRARSGQEGRYAVFQPTRPYGARHRSWLDTSLGNTFQPTRPYGARLMLDDVEHRIHVVSTHAPLWGATCCNRRSNSCTRSFNPRAPIGRDQYPVLAHTVGTPVSTHAPL